MRVLITGTTSGLGRALAAHYDSRGYDVIGVNRRDFDISDYVRVRDYLEALIAEGRTPDLFVLNAGINRPDNVEGLDYETFELVMRTNLGGVLTFVGAIRELGLKGKTIAGISSSSNIVPNPGHIGYYLSKWAIAGAFRLLERNDPENRYRTVILGPVRTNIMAGYSGPTGLAGKIFDWLAISPERAARRLARFFDGGRTELSYPRPAWLFYLAARILLRFLPGLYRGTRISTKTCGSYSS